MNNTTHCVGCGLELDPRDSLLCEGCADDQDTLDRSSDPAGVEMTKTTWITSKEIIGQIHEV